MTDLTDRYIWAAIRSVPIAQRADLERELRERIGDETDALVEQGRTEAEAERTALTELGDPVALAADYVDRPLHLIGPKYYLMWWRLLKLLLAVVLPFVALGSAIAQAVSGAPAGGIVGGVIGLTLSVAVHIAFWTTFVFAMVERLPARQGQRPIEVPWTVDQLPALADPAKASRLGDLIASLVFLAVFAVALVWQQFGIPWVPELQQVPLLQPELWSFWLPYFLGLIVLEALFAVAVYLLGWTWWLAAVNLVLNAAFVIPAVWLFLTGQLVSEPALEAMNWPWGDSAPVIVAVIVVTVIGVAIWDVVDGAIKAARAGGARRAEAQLT
ncbi:permease prefix domain 1-containing protein [Agromyces sp. G08B096]|uniref:Permease prefix domain 1-containing protein n=1 Tax=Agromyces sp. G08B096 TaxID=3156399 RepID=A0AAU7W5X1_9MICO